MDPMKRALLQAMMGDGNDDDSETLSVKETAEKLLSSYAAYSVEHDFKPGQLVQKKAGSNYKYPVYGYPAVVVSVDNPPADNKTGGHQVENPETMMIGFVHNKSFSMLMVSPLRFEPFSG